MDRLRICIDTSVLGGCFDEEFALWSNGLIRDFLAGHFIPVLSDVAAAEVREAPEAVQEVHREMLRLAGEVLPVTAEAVDLVEAVSGGGLCRGCPPTRCLGGPITPVPITPVARPPTNPSYRLMQEVTARILAVVDPPE